MVFAGLNYLAVLVAAVAGFAFGGIWYGVLFGKRWRAIVGVDAFKPRPTQMLIAFVAHLLMAWMLAGVVGHLGEVTITRTLISAAFLWVGFVRTDDDDRQSPLPIISLVVDCHRRRSLARRVTRDGPCNRVAWRLISYALRNARTALFHWSGCSKNGRWPHFSKVSSVARGIFLDASTAFA